jgi:hypothetical protein
VGGIGPGASQLRGLDQGKVLLRVDLATEGLDALLVVCPTAQAAVAGNQPAGQQPSPAAVDAAVRRATRPWDIALVEFVGLLGATVAATVALRRSRGTTDPYSLPAALAMLKVFIGALTAFLGLELVRAEFIPGLTALDSSAQIIAWAVVLGYAQQLFTRAIDQQAQTLLSEAQEPTAPPPAPEEMPSQLQPTAPLSGSANSAIESSQEPGLRQERSLSSSSVPVARPRSS